MQLQDDFMEQLTDRVVAAMDRQDRPALKLAAAVREHVVFHGLHRSEAFVTDSEIRALTDAPRRALIAKRDAYQAIFSEMIRDGIRDGSLRDLRRPRRDLRDPPAVHRGRALVRPGRPAGARGGRRAARRARARLPAGDGRADRRGDRARLPANRRSGGVERHGDQATRAARAGHDRGGRAGEPAADPLGDRAGDRLLRGPRSQGRPGPEPSQGARLPRRDRRGAGGGPAVGAERARDRHGPRARAAATGPPASTPDRLGARSASRGSSAASATSPPCTCSLARHAGWVSFYGPNFLRFTRTQGRLPADQGDRGVVPPRACGRSRSAGCSRTPRIRTC